MRRMESATLADALLVGEACEELPSLLCHRPRPAPGAISSHSVGHVVHLHQPLDQAIHPVDLDQPLEFCRTADFNFVSHVLVDKVTVIKNLLERIGVNLIIG